MADSTRKPGLLGRIFAPFRMLMSFPFSTHLQRYGRFSAWVIIVTAVIASCSTIAYTSFHKSLHPSFDSREAKTVRAGSIYSDFLTNEGESIGSVRAGQQVEMLAYGNGYFLIQTTSGERGWVEAAVMDNKFIVATHDYGEEAPLGDTYTFNRYEGEMHFDMVATSAKGKRHTFKKYELFPTVAIGLPSLGLDDSFSRRYIYVTERWMAKHFVEGAEYEKMCESYYGYPVVVDVVDSHTKNVTFPVRVKDFKTNVFHPKVVAKFVDDKLVDYQLTEDGKIPFVERYIPFGGRIASTRLFIKLRSRPFLVEPKYDNVDELIKDNQEGKQLNKWVRIGLVVLLLMLGYIALMANLMLAPLLFHLVDRIPFVPSTVGKWSLMLSLPIGFIVLYMIYTPHWIILALMFFFGFGIYMGLAVWEIYSHCPSCRKYYVMRTLGYGKAHTRKYDEVIRHATEEVTKRGGREVSRRIVNTWDEIRHHEITTQDEYLVCDHCKQKMVVLLENGKAVSGTLVDEWPPQE